VEVKSTYYYNIHIEKNKKKEESIMGTKFKYLLILDKNYNEFSNIINRYKKI
jgi:hypothetical protein